jgi:hypothetical protein
MTGLQLVGLANASGPPRCAALHCTAGMERGGPSPLPAPMCGGTLPGPLGGEGAGAAQHAPAGGVGWLDALLGGGGAAAGG